MTPREWFLVALRLLAIYLGVLLVMQAGSYLILMSGEDRFDLGRYLGGTLPNVAIAALLFFAAPWIARRLYPGSPPMDLDAVFGPPGSPVATGGATPSDAFVVGRRILGLYAIFAAVAPLARIATNLFESSEAFGWAAARNNIIYASVYVLFGIVLLAGPRDVWRRLTRGVGSLRPPPPAEEGGDPGASPGERP